MKKYALYPGIGRVGPDTNLGYISGRQLAACYRIPYSDCLDTDNPAIKKVLDLGRTLKGPPIHLIHLLPKESGKYRLPSGDENRIIVSEGLMDAINKNG